MDKLQFLVLMYACVVLRRGPSRCFVVRRAGVVPEPARQVAQDGEDVAAVEWWLQLQHHGRVRTLRRHGPPLAASAPLHRPAGRRVSTNISSRRRRRCPLHAVAAQ